MLTVGTITAEQTAEQKLQEQRRAKDRALESVYTIKSLAVIMFENYKQEGIDGADANDLTRHIAELMLQAHVAGTPLPRLEDWEKFFPVDAAMTAAFIEKSCVYLCSLSLLDIKHKWRKQIKAVMDRPALLACPFKERESYLL